MNNDTFNDVIDPEGWSQTKYSSFLGTFIQEVEHLSIYGGDCWKKLCCDIDIYIPTYDKDSWLVKWIPRRSIPDLKFHLQCAYLVREGLYESSDMGSYWWFPDGDGSLRGEEQTAGAFAECRADKNLISSLFVVALMQSGDRNQGRKDEFELQEFSGRLPKTRARSTNAGTPRHRRPGWALSDVARSHLRSNEIWHHWHSSCTSLMPMIGDLQRSKKIYESYYDLATYLAEQFVLMTTKYSVCTFNFVSKPDPSVMSRIDKMVKKNRIKNAESDSELKKKREESKKKSEEIEQQRIAESKEKELQLQKNYDLACEKILTYATSVPKIFEELNPLHEKWRRLPKEQLEVLIWSAPVTVLAKMFDTSDNGLRKWAKAVGVECPERGFWEKVQAKKIKYPNGKPQRAANFLDNRDR